ncbi:MAG: 16S rRNA (adenine(1518)-N(6)/adenine(1519)-N(6))-dimethyltransferase RsmA [Chloroflexota bacterium]
MSPRRPTPRPARRQTSRARRLGVSTKPKTAAPRLDDMPDYLRRLGVPPRKALGQHYLVDELILHNIAEAAALTPDDVVLEIGAGPGGLTEELAKQGATVVAVEIDEELAGGTRARLSEYDRLHVLAADILDFEPIELLQEAGVGAPYVAVGNLPYYITQPIVRRLLEADPAPTRIVVLVQREVAQRMVGGPRRESLLSLSVKVYGVPRLLFDVPSTAFWPPPKVQSAVVEITRLDRPAIDLPPADLEVFFHMLRAGFAQPRKQIHNVFPEELGLEPPQVREVLAAAGIDPVARAQHLDLADWERLFRTFNELYPHGLEMNRAATADDDDASDEWDEDDDDTLDVHDDA